VSTEPAEVVSSTGLSGRIAVITGASSGIGAQTARALAAAGAIVALMARRVDRLDAIVSEVKASGGTATAYPLDVTDGESLSAAAAAIRADFGPASIVVNNAGIMLPTGAKDLAGADSRRQIELNVTALNSVISAFVDQLVESAAALGSSDLVNTASIAGKALFPGFASYAASKAYVVHLGNNLRAELGPKNVRVTTLEPGIVETELQGHIGNEAVRARLAGTRDRIEWLTAADVAEVLTFIVSRPARVNLSEVAILPTRQP
jgi:NADP-dependent 3-hydroxy acid dehydrogenase YdfG